MNNPEKSSIDIIAAASLLGWSVVIMILCAWDVKNERRQTEALSKYDAGIFYDNIPRCSYNLDHFKYNVASKFFTYLEAGLPIVVFEEDEYMRRQVEQYKLGSVYKAREPKSIIQAIGEVVQNDYSPYIEQYLKNKSMKNNTASLLRAHKL